MKRISLILASLVLVFGSTKASAFVGGPFDNGDFSSLLDDSGVYQVAFRFSNGSGFAQFGNNVTPALFQTATAATAGVPNTMFSYLNRSIFYYKGVSYLGTCIGMVDHERKFVHGVCNANSDVGTTSVTNTGTTGTSSSLATAASSTLLNNGGNALTANADFQCKITNSHPVLRFVGTGELSILNPSIGQLVLQGLQTIIQNPTTSVAGIGGGGGGTTVILVPTLGAQISSLLTAVTDNQDTLNEVLPTTQQIRDNSDHIKISAFGSRIFFVSTR
jgi:hypothetical protein